MGLVEHMFDTLGCMTDLPRRALRQPRSLTVEQYAVVDVTTASTPAAVRAWVVWEDGVEELVAGMAVAWTRRAVRVRWGAPPHIFETWVWAGAVERV